MEEKLEHFLNDLTIEQLIKTPHGERLQQAMHIFEKIKNHYFALEEKQGEMEMTGIKVVTILTFSILRKIANGKKPSELDKDDWKDIATDISQYAILTSDQQYSIFIFSLYEQYIRHSMMQIEEHISEETASVINGLVDELHSKAEDFSTGCISEVAYIEDCLWISLEAMIKLLACTATLYLDLHISEFAQALASYAFEYGRLMLYSKELKIVNHFIESQYLLDCELQRKYELYLEDLKKESLQFYILIDNAFTPNFRDAFLHSIILAKTLGVKEEEILSSPKDIDSFFLY